MHSQWHSMTPWTPLPGHCQVQHKLLTLPWPDQLLTQPDAGLVYSPDVTHAELVLFKGLRVRMAIHTGRPEAVQVRNLRTNGCDESLYWATTSSKTTRDELTLYQVSPFS